MRQTIMILAATLFALTLSACAETQSGVQTSAADRDPSFNCPSGNCVGTSSVRFIGGNGSGF